MLRHSAVFRSRVDLASPVVLPLFGSSVKATINTKIRRDAVPLMRVRFADGNRQHLERPLGVREVLFAPSLSHDASSGDSQDVAIFSQLVDELTDGLILEKERRDRGLKLVALHAQRHSGTARFDVSDRSAPTCWVDQKVPTLRRIVDRVVEFMQMDQHHPARRISARLNFYSDFTEDKPFHLDAHAFDASEVCPTSLAGVQNTTAIFSVGATRTLAFQEGPLMAADEEAMSPAGVVAVDLTPGSLVSFGRETNKLFRHGVLPGGRRAAAANQQLQGAEPVPARSGIDALRSADPANGARFSISVMGWTTQQEEHE